MCPNTTHTVLVLEPSSRRAPSGSPPARQLYGSPRGPDWQRWIFSFPSGPSRRVLSKPARHRSTARARVEFLGPNSNHLVALRTPSWPCAHTHTPVCGTHPRRGCRKQGVFQKPGCLPRPSLFASDFQTGNFRTLDVRLPSQSVPGRGGGDESARTWIYVHIYTYTHSSTQFVYKKNKTASYPPMNSSHVFTTRRHPREGPAHAVVVDKIITCIHSHLLSYISDRRIGCLLPC